MVVIEHQCLCGQVPIQVSIAVSDDLINWEQHSWIIDASRLPEDCPYNGRFWALKFITSGKIRVYGKQ